MLLAEVAPAAPFLIDALPSLLLLAGLFFIVGCIYALRSFVQALLNSLAAITSVIPFFGGIASSAIHHAEQAISNALGSAESYFDAHISAQFHRLARIAEHLWQQIEATAHTALLIAKMASGYAALTDILRLEHQLRRLVHAAEHAAGAAIHHALANAKAFTRTIAHGVYPRLRAVEHDVTKVIPKELKRTRTLAKEAEAEAARAWNLVRTKPWEIGATAFAGAVAIALTSLGLEWLKCNSAKSFFKKAGCGFWKLLEDALGVIAVVALSIFGVLRPEVLAESAVSAVDALEPILAEILKD
jgi:hypothetical protein